MFIKGCEIKNDSITCINEIKYLQNLHEAKQIKKVKGENKLDYDIKVMSKDIIFPRYIIEDVYLKEYKFALKKQLYT